MRMQQSIQKQPSRGLTATDRAPVTGERFNTTHRSSPWPASCCRACALLTALRILSRSGCSRVGWGAGSCPVIAVQVPLVGGTIGANICTHEQIPGMATTSRRSPLSSAYHSVSKENWGVNAQQQHARLFKGHWIHLLVAEQGWVGVGQARQRDCRGGQGWAGGVRSSSARVPPDRVNVQCVEGLAALVHLSTARRY